jgi:hypothetical protein
LARSRIANQQRLLASAKNLSAKMPSLALGCKGLAWSRLPQKWRETGHFGLRKRLFRDPLGWFETV